MTFSRPTALLLAALCTGAAGSIATPATDAPAPVPAPPPAGAAEATADEIAQSMLVLARRMFERNDPESAETAYTDILNSPVSDAIIQDALIDYAELLRKTNRNTRAAAIYEKYLASYPGATRAPSVLIALGRTLRDMGAFNLAQARFYAVLNSTLAVSLENLPRYRDLAQLAKFEIAETYYQQGDYAAAGKFFGRIKLLDLPPEDRARAGFREAYAFFLDGKLEQAVAALRTFLELYPQNPSAQEGRYLLCLSLRRLGRTQEALAETLTLLRSAQAQSDTDRETWSYWQRRTGIQLANDFYEQGDFNSALTIYQTLAELRADPGWRWPALYQIALCYERLRQPDRAAAQYRNILDEYAAAEKTGNLPDGPTGEIHEMARWRLGQIDWANRVDQSVRQFAVQQAETGEMQSVQ